MDWKGAERRIADKNKFAILFMMLDARISRLEREIQAEKERLEELKQEIKGE